MASNAETALLVIDVQAGSFAPSPQRGFGGMEVKDQEAYLSSLSNTVEKFREQGSPIIWATIGEGSGFIPPVGNSPDVKSQAHLNEMGWMGGPPPQNEQTRLSLESFQNFSRTDGPRDCDAAVKKMGFNAFNPNESGGDGLHRYLQEMGIKNVALAGGNADVCVTASAFKKRF